MSWLAVLAFGYVSGVVGGIAGFGGSTILLPVLVLVFGSKAAVPIMGVAGLLANLARVTVWRHEIDWRAVATYAATAVPAVYLGATTFLALNSRSVELVLGLFMLVMIPVRRWLAARQLSIGLAGMAVAGAVVGYLTGLVASTGPLSTPFFLAFGLTKGAFIGTEAMASVPIYFTKSAVLQRYGALPVEIIIQGLIVGSAMIAGTWTARDIVRRMDARRFGQLMEGLLLFAGMSMLGHAVFGG